MSSKDQTRLLLQKDGRVLHFPSAFDQPFQALRSSIDWQEEDIRIFGKWVKVPRLIAYYGEFPYTYSSTAHPAKPLPECLQVLQKKLEQKTGAHFNAVLCNLYRDGNDSMGWHRDNEPEIDPAFIASLSFGEARDFKLRHRTDKDVVKVTLGNGDLLLMEDCQTHWEHCLPKTAKPRQERINLTFRKMLPPQA